MLSLLSIIEFLKKYWTIILPIIAVWIVYFMFVSLENERDDALKQLADIKATMASQKTANDKALEKAKNDQVEYESNIANLHIDKTTLTNAIKGYYNAPSHSKPVMVPNTGIVLSSSASSSATETSTSTEGLASSESVSGGTCTAMEAKIKTLEDALATETIDFNRARARLDRDCEQIGCLTSIE